MLQAAITKEKKGSRVLEFASLEDTSVTRTQVEMRDGLVFMRAKKRLYVFT